MQMGCLEFVLTLGCTLSYKEMNCRKVKVLISQFSGTEVTELLISSMTLYMGTYSSAPNFVEANSETLLNYDFSLRQIGLIGQVFSQAQTVIWM